MMPPQAPFQVRPPGQRLLPLRVPARRRGGPDLPEVGDQLDLGARVGAEEPGRSPPGGGRGVQRALLLPRHGEYDGLFFPRIDWLYRLKLIEYMRP